ncbi:MAG: hypothetical protein ACM3O6_09870 [Acidobacteriota bacterium]
MSLILDRPLLLFIVSILVQWAAAYVGDLLRKRGRAPSSDERDDFNTIQTATLTLLALIIGFSFSMAVSRYDQRKNYEEAEANAIGTEYVRADLLPTDIASRVRELLRKYVDQRIAFYETRDELILSRVDVETAKLQAELWSAILPVAKSEPTPVTALAISGMNDVLNSQGYTQAAWWNRIPVAAWVLMVLIAISCNMLIGYSERRKGSRLLAILPVVLSTSFFLIADIDSPRLGVIHVLPHNLIALADSIKPH